MTDTVTGTDAGETSQQATGDQTAPQQNDSADKANNTPPGKPDILNNIYQYYGGTHIELPGLSTRKKLEASRVEEPRIADDPYPFEKNDVEEKYSLLITKRILVLHSLDYSVLQYYANVLCRLVLNREQKREVRSLTLTNGSMGDERITLRDYQKRFLNTDEVSGPQILLVTDRYDYEPHEPVPFFQSMIDESHGAETFRNTMMQHDHLIIYKFGGFDTLRKYKENRNKWNFSDVWDIPFFPQVLFVRYYPREIIASEYESKIRQQQQEKKWHIELRDFLKEISIALKDDLLDQIILEKAHQDYRLPAPVAIHVKTQELIEADTLHPFVLFVAAFFDDVTLGEFNQMLTLLLKQHDAVRFNGEHKSNKSLFVKWQVDGDRIIRRCDLVYDAVDDTVERIRFAEYQTRKKVQDFLKKYYAIFLLRQAEVLVNAGYWLHPTFGSANVKNLAFLVGYIGVNNPDGLVKSFIGKGLTAMERERRKYVTALRQITLIQRHLNRTDLMLKKELQYDDLFAGIYDMENHDATSAEEIRKLYFNLIYGDSSIDEKSSIEEYRRILKKSFENGETNKARLTYEKEQASQAYFQVVDRMTSYVTPLMKNSSLRDFILECIREEILAERRMVSAFAVVSSLYEYYPEESLAIIKHFLQSHQKSIREQSFLALVHFIRSNPASLFDVARWGPSRDTKIEHIETISWLENSALASILEISRDGIEFLSFSDAKGQQYRICQPSSALREQTDTWGTRQVPLALFANLQVVDHWQALLALLLDWLLDPLTSAAGRRQAEGARHSQQEYREYQNSVIEMVAWLINAWSQVLLGKDPGSAYARNAHMVTFMLTHLARHQDKSVTQRIRTALGLQPGSYNEYIKYLNDADKSKPFGEQREFARKLLSEFDALRQETETFV
jgi:hypothetical protein